MELLIYDDWISPENVSTPWRIIAELYPVDKDLVKGLRKSSQDTTRQGGMAGDIIVLDGCIVGLWDIDVW